MMDTVEIGQVLRASTEGFTCGTRSSDVKEPAFGAFVRTTDVQGMDNLMIIGVITAIRVDDDPLVRQLIMSNSTNQAAIRDQRENRMIPIEIDVLNIGYVENGYVHHTLPPRPPMSLDSVLLCVPDEVEYVTQDYGFFRPILSAAGVPNAVELASAAIRKAAAARPPDLQYDYLVEVGRQLASILSHDPQTLQHLLKMIRPLR